MAAILLLLCGYAGYGAAVYRFSARCLGGLKYSRRLFAVISVGGILAWGICWRSGFLRVDVLAYDMLVVLFLCLSFREETGKKILTAAAVITIRTLLGNFAAAFLDFFYLAVTGPLAGGRVAGIGESSADVIEGLSFLAAAAALLFLGGRMAAVLANGGRSWHLVLSALLFSVVLITEMVNRAAENGIMVVSNPHSGRYWGIYYDRLFSDGAVCLLTALCMCIAGGLVFGTDRIFAEQRNAERYRAQMRLYEILHEQYAQTERLRHDMKNHVLALYGLWEDDERDKLGAYLRQMIAHGGIAVSEDVTGSRAVDALLCHKRAQAGRRGIRWESDVRIPRAILHSEFDLCVLFGNILDNALNACEEDHAPKDRFVSVMAQQIKGCLLIVVKNSTGLKDVGEIRKGIGFRNIEETVKKYHGTLSVTVEAQAFEIAVLLPFADGHSGEQTD